MRTVLGIETSCDETAAAVVADGWRVCSSVVSSQVDIHVRYGGVVPEIASRAHLEILGAVVEDALAQARVEAPAGLDAIAVTCGPGLVGSLLVGVSQAKGLALAWGLPFVGVNHLEGHLFAPFLVGAGVGVSERPAATEPAPERPAGTGPSTGGPAGGRPGAGLDLPVVVLLVSGGHTLLVEMAAPGRYRLLGQTLDDAAGEAYDKVARYLGLPYPGGPAVDRVAAEGDDQAFAFPRALSGQGYDFSFSGLKTAVVRAVERQPEAATADVAASFQRAVVDVLVEKACRAAEDTGARGICLAGGVAANSLLRRRLTEAGEGAGLPVHLPTRQLCTDNAAMIAAAGHWRLTHDGTSPWDLGAEPNLGLPLGA